MALRAFWEQTSRHSEVDRIELHDAEYGGAEPELQFKGDATGFTRQWDEITSESNDKLINVQANRIQIGKYDFRPRIEDATGFQILEDIRDSDNKRFHIVHKIDGNFEWAGWVTTRIFSYPEKANNFFAHIRATDFEILKGIDYPLIDTRQTFITTFADLFSELPTNVPIKTATSWVEENLDNDTNITKPYDFLNYIRHQTKALRDFAKTGDETDQPITKWEALEHVAEPGLLIRQMGGHVMIDQLTDLADPTSVNETIYDSTGSVTTATQSVDRRQAGYTTTDNGTPSIKVTSQNDTYPAIKRTRATFDHRSSVSALQLPSNVYISGADTETYTQQFAPSTNQQIRFSANIVAEYDQDFPSGEVNITIRQGQYYWNGVDWVQDNSARVTVNLTNNGLTIERSGTTYYLYAGTVNVSTSDIPTDATTPTEVVLPNALINASPDVVAQRTEYNSISFSITNIQDSEANSAAIVYQLTQDNVDYAEFFNIGTNWFGDGPTPSAPSALRYDTDSGDITSNTWRRRGQAIAYRNYHNNLLHEVIDMGRTNMRKLEADIWGAYDPTKVLDYNGSYFFFAGGRYDGTTGKWNVTLMELNLQTGSDTFDDIPKFTDETGSGSGSTSSSGGGGVDQSTGDARWANESANLSDLDDAAAAISNLGITATASELNRLDGNLTTVRPNLGLEIGVDVQGHSDILDDISLFSADDGNFIVGNGTTFVEESGNAARTSLGLGATDSVSFAQVTIDGSISATQTWVTNNFDNYDFWTISDGGSSGNVGSTIQLTIDANDGITTSYDSGTSTLTIGNDDKVNSFTYNDTNDTLVIGFTSNPNPLTLDLLTTLDNRYPNWYLNGVSYDGTNNEIDFSVSGGIDQSLDLTTSLDNRYLQSYTETDPTVPSHVKNITTTDIDQWDDAYAERGSQIAGNGLQWNALGSNQLSVVGYSPNDWNEAYNNYIASATGSGNGTLTLTQNDGGTVTANLSHNHNYGFTLSNGSTTSNVDVVLGDTVTIQGGSNVGVSQSGNTLTITSSDTQYGSWTLSDGTNTVNIGSGATASFAGGTGVTTSLSSSTITFNNTKYLTGLSFDSGTGELEAILQDLSTVSTNLDGRYYKSGDSPTFAGGTYTGLLTVQGGIDASDQITLTTLTNTNKAGVIIDASSAGNETWYEVINGDNYYGRFGVGINNDVFFNTDAPNGFRFIGGNVGVLTFPDRPLHVKSTEWDNSSGAGAIFENSNSVGAGITLKPNASAVTNGANGWAMYAGAGSAAIGDGNLGFWAHGTNISPLYLKRDNTVVVDSQLAVNKTGATEALDVNGNINVSGVSYGSDHAESDSRIKSNVTDADPLKVARLARLKTFDHRDKEGNQIGLIADHFDNAHPSLIHWKNDKQFGQIRTLNTYGLASVALAGVGELDRKQQTQTSLIKQLRNRVANLEQQIKTLKKTG